MTGIRSTTDGVEISVRVIPRARTTAVTGMRGESIVVRLAAPPVDGAANEALIDFFANVLRVPSRAIRLLSGERGREKRLAIAGVTVDQIRALL